MSKLNKTEAKAALPGLTDQGAPCTSKSAQAQDPKPMGRKYNRRKPDKPVSDGELADRVALGLKALADLTLADRMKVLTGITAVHGLEITVKVHGANMAAKPVKTGGAAVAGTKVKSPKVKKPSVAKLTEAQKADPIIHNCLAAIAYEKEGLKMLKGATGTQGHQDAIAAAKLQITARVAELSKNEDPTCGDVCNEAVSPTQSGQASISPL